MFNSTGCFVNDNLEIKILVFKIVFEYVKNYTPNRIQISKQFDALYAIHLQMRHIKYLLNNIIGLLLFLAIGVHML